MVPENKRTGYAMATALFANALLFPALFIYLGNVDYFASSITQLLKFFVVLFAVVLLFTMVLLAVCGAKQRRVVSLLLATCSILFWVQGTFLIWDFGVLDGSAIDWQKHRLQLWIDVLVWGVGVGITLLLIRNNRSSWVMQCALLMFIVQAASATVKFLALPSDDVALAQKRASADALQDVVDFSKNQNVLHILIDAFQADVFEDLVNAPELKDGYDQSFDGFVYYRETLGVFPRTKYSVPASLSGQAYDNKTEHGYIETVMAGDTILSAARDNQFEIDIVTDGNARFLQYSKWPHNNIFDLKDLLTSGKELQESALLVDLALLRILPGGLKKIIYNSQQWRVSKAFMRDSEHLMYEYFTSALFMNYLTSNMSAERVTPVYKFLHLMNTHGPLVATKECRYAGGVYPHVRETYMFTAKCTLDMLSNLFAKMKTLGIYDDALIVLHADHGGWVKNYRQPTEQTRIRYQLSPEGPVTYLPVTIRSAASPLLAIKTPGAKGRIVTENTLASLLDIPDTISEAMGWSARFGNWSLLTASETKMRKRFFRYYNREKTPIKNDFTGPLIEYRISGSHYESEWIIDGVLLPGDSL